MKTYMKRLLSLLLAAVLLLSMQPAVFAAGSGPAATEDGAYKYGVYADYKYTVHVNAPGTKGYLTDPEPTIKFDSVTYGETVAASNKAVLTFHNVGKNPLELTFGSCTYADVKWDSSNGKIAPQESAVLTVTLKNEIPVNHGTTGLLLMEQNSRVGWTAILDVDVKKAAVNVAAANKTKYFGETLTAADIDPTVSGGVTSLAALEALGYTIISEGFAPGAKVGSYDVKLTAGENADPNFDVDTTTAITTVTVNKAIPKQVWVNAPSVKSEANLSDYKLEGAYCNPYTDEAVPGKLTWKDGGAVDTVDKGETKTIQREYTFTPDDPNYNAVEDTVSVTVVGKDVTTIGLKDASQLNVTYDGKSHLVGFTTNHGTVKVEYKAEEGTWTEKAPQNAGTYQVQATVEEGSNYASDIYTAVLTINPVDVKLRLAEPGAITNKKYDGTPTATLNVAGSPDALSNTGRIQFSGVVSGDTLKIDYEKVTAVFSDANVGRDKSVTVTVPAEAVTKDPNYVFNGQTFITKGDISTMGITLTMNNITKQYGQETEIVDADFEAPDLVNGDGKDAVHVVLSSDGTKAAAAVGEYKVTATKSWGNYEVTGVSGVIKVEAATPVAAGAVSAANGGTGTYLSKVSLSGTFQNPYTGEIVSGTLKWNEADNTTLPGTETTTSYHWVFTPNDTKNYATVSGETEVTTTEKPPVDVKFEAPSNLVFDGQPKQAKASSTDKAATFSYRYCLSGTETWIPAPINAGTYDVEVTATVPGTDEYANNTIIGTMIIQPAKPTGTASTADKPEAGALLGDVKLTGTFKGVDGTELEGTLSWNNVGGELPGAVPVQYGTAYGWTFTPDDGNYTAVTGTIQFKDPASPGGGGGLGGGGETPPVQDPDQPEDPETPEEPGTPTDPETPPAASETYTDVPAGVWYEEAVSYVVAKGLMKGTGDTSFAPNDTTTRGMIATILYRMEGEPGITPDDLFPDVADGKWYTEAIQWAAANDVVQGYSNGTFGPNDNITREQMAVMLWRYAGQPASTQSLADFSDAGTVSSWAQTAISWAVEEGLIQGSGGKLTPGANATRAQVATILMRYCAIISAQ